MCRVIAKTNGMDKEKWLMLRKQGIGGSDAGAVCGLNPYVSPMEVYADKTGSTLDGMAEDNEAMREGRDFEDYVAKRFTEATGIKVRRANVMYASKKYPFMIADVDRLIVGKENGLVGLECKTASPYSKEKWKDGNIPAHYLIQCHHYMAVLGAKAWYIAVIIYGQEFKYVKIERDEETIQNLTQIETDFWNNHVRKGIMPEPDGSDAADKFIRGHFAESIQEKTVPLIGFDEKLHRMGEISKLLKKLETEKKKIEQEIKTYMGEAEFAENQNFLVSWKDVTSHKVNVKRLKEEMPDVYRDFLYPSHSRKFLVKAV